MDGFEDQLSRLFRDKLPPLSEPTKEALVRFLPWILIVFGCLGLMAWVYTMGLFGFAGRMAMG